MPASCATLLPLGDLAVTNNSVHLAGDLCAEHPALLRARTLNGDGNACLAGALTIGGIEGGESLTNWGRYTTEA